MHCNIVRHQLNLNNMEPKGDEAIRDCQNMFAQEHITWFAIIRQSLYRDSFSYVLLVYTETVDSLEGSLWLASQTPNILCYLPPSNLAKNGFPVCIRDKCILSNSPTQCRWLAWTAVNYYWVPGRELRYADVRYIEAPLHAVRSTFGNNLFFYCLQFNGVLSQLTGLNRCSGAALASHTFKYLSQLNSENDMP